MDLQLEGKTALVTGATAGIGLEIARALATEGARVIITGRDGAKLDKAIAVVEASGGSNVTGVLADAATVEGAGIIAKAEPLVDVLVNNLGIYESKPFGDIPDADWSYLFDVNVMSGVRLSRTYLPGMLERNWGRVVFISSESGLAIPQDMIHYATTKTAQLSVSRGLAQLTRGTNVTVNAVLPGPTRSEGIEGFLRSQASDPSASIKQIEAEFFATARSASILQRMVEAEEVANLVAYLASPRSSATNGAALRAEGGLVNTIA
ncbi:SDR family NAD(P)-dependent oxidoreductase [Rhizobium leguminosarum bv. viciae]|jgi:NAD(P)-dependent dehydrogenase (short-subunit alcohol dehydrogenase family)|uniref:SDR family NAD(P)-dependent oxidoreductase n=1 Tax=Rhizobium leguminosarum bv. viciae TaxID=387 RepID=A0A8I2GXH5_RHILV|nr:SDR family oxidoreductase [Rhizobium leguminosarum]MBY5795305.1 SDR family oxidoreductase [Rhizobium leguminosarum]MBY5824531.1 SDR family oxidoreductase [Rhizobium leguminosarum]NKM47169.1 SDR family NAD(P)-dependent oxidoreductase [Rhizobium leguminosarum bv. viciae]